MKVILESPFANENLVVRNENLLYLNCLSRYVMIKVGLAPLYFHSLYTQCLDDSNESERAIGLYRSFEFHDHLPRLVSVDRGISKGMELGVKSGIEKGADFQFYSLDFDDIKLESLISEINGIADLNERMTLGIKMLREYLGEPNELGDYTNYREQHLELYNDVKANMLNFFEPLIDYIKA